MFDVDCWVVELFGVFVVFDVVWVIMVGDVDFVYFDVVGDDWDIEVCVEVVLVEVGFVLEFFDCCVGEFFGGEVVFVVIVGIWFCCVLIMFFDELINNFDCDVRVKFVVMV